VINSKPQKTARPKGLGLFLYLELLIFDTKNTILMLVKQARKPSFFYGVRAKNFLDGGENFCPFVRSAFCHAAAP